MIELESLVYVCRPRLMSYLAYLSKHSIETFLMLRKGIFGNINGSLDVIMQLVTFMFPLTSSGLRLNFENKGQNLSKTLFNS